MNNSNPNHISNPLPNLDFSPNSSKLIDQLAENSVMPQKLDLSSDTIISTATATESKYYFASIDNNCITTFDKILTTTPDEPINLLNNLEVLDINNRVPDAFDLTEVFKKYSVNKGPTIQLKALPPDIEGDVSASFINGLLIAPLPSVNDFFSCNNDLKFAQSASRIFTRIEDLIDISIGTQIEDTLLNTSLHRHTILLLAATGFFVQPYPTAFTNFFASFGHTDKTQDTYYELNCSHIANFNFTTKVNAIARNACEMAEISSQLIAIANLTPIEWAAFLTHPQNIVEPPL